MDQYVPLALHGLVAMLNSHFRNRQEFLLVANDLKQSHAWLVELVKKLENIDIWTEIASCTSRSYAHAELIEGDGSATIVMTYPDELTILELQKWDLPRGFHFKERALHYVHVETSKYTLSDESPVSQH